MSISFGSKFTNFHTFFGSGQDGDFNLDKMQDFGGNYHWGSVWQFNKFSIQKSGYMYFGYNTNAPKYVMIFSRTLIEISGTLLVQSGPPNTAGQEITKISTLGGSSNVDYLLGLMTSKFYIGQNGGERWDIWKWYSTVVGVLE